MPAHTPVSTDSVVVGSRWTLKQNVSLPHISVYVPAGASGTITDIGDRDGECVSLRLDEPVANLETWDNELAWSGDDAFDIDGSLDGRVMVLHYCTPAA
jgi:hypothetical protein